jgi:DNA invertase Pin-like site-specific DNA recombinase
MKTLAYFFVGTDGEEAMPQFEVIGDSHHAVQWFADMTSMASVAALERPGFVELLRFARKGDVLIVSLVSHLGSSAAELLTALQALESTGVTVVSLR